MSENTGPAPGGTQEQPPQVSAEEMRKYLEQLRTAPAEQVVAEVLSSLLTAAQAKLGRHDARLLIDVASLVLGHGRPYVAEQMTTQVDQMLSQLRFAQVDAEGKAAQSPHEEANDLPTAPPPPAQGASAGQASPAQPTQQPPTSKLWVPGR